MNDYRRLTKEGKKSTEIMKELIELGHVVPTAPDFTDCFPFQRKEKCDPLALDELPHVFFAGNQEEYSREVVDFGDNRKVLLLGIPRFNTSRTMVVVNLRNFQISRVIASPF